MNHVSIADAEARFSELVTQAENGQSTEIVRHGKVVARLVPAEQLAGLERLRQHLATMPYQDEAAADLIRQLRDDERPKIDIAALLEHQQSLTSPMEDTDTALRDWKDGSRY